MKRTPLGLALLVAPCLLLAPLAAHVSAQNLKPVAGPKRATKPPPAPKAPNEADKIAGLKVGPEALTRFVVDESWKKSDIGFTSKTQKETIKGKAGKVVGHMDINPRTLETASGTFTVEWNDVDTGKPKMNEHLRSPPWIDAVQHPRITFKLKGLEKVKPAANGKSAKATLVGVWEMNGLEKDMQIPATIAYIEAPKGKSDAKEGVSIRCILKLGLADFEIVGKGVGSSVASKIDVKIAVFLSKSDQSPGSEPPAADDGDEDDKPKKDDGMGGGGG